MKRILYITSCLFFCTSGNTQQNSPSAMLNSLNDAVSDSARYLIYAGLTYYYMQLDRDSALYYIEKRLEIARKNNKKLPEIKSLEAKAIQLMQLGKYAESYSNYLEALRIAEEPESQNSYWHLQGNLTPRQTLISTRAGLHNSMGIMFGLVNNPDQQLFHYKESKRLWEESTMSPTPYFLNLSLGRIYLEMGKLDSALYFTQMAEKQSIEDSALKALGGIWYTMGQIYYFKKENELSKYYFHKGIAISISEKNKAALVASYTGLSNLFRAESRKDSCLFYAKGTLQEIQQIGSVPFFNINAGTSYETLSLAYSLSNKPDSAFKYLELATHIKDSLYKEEKKGLIQFQEMTLNEKIRIQELEKEKSEYRSKVRTNLLLGGVGLLLIVVILIYRNYRQQRRDKNKIKQTYYELRDTQQQLIQSEKMASLGDLTAGIAHEIQNPLNFVNNFSDVNTELIDEAEMQIDKGNINEGKMILNDIKENEQKINHHGKRADAIVKSMLQHSRTSSGKKELTDINALADEYLRLAYHGLRAKDKSFNAKFDTSFDNSIGRISIIPQDIGRVILNLINNAFYAVTEKKKAVPPSPKGEKEDASLIYEPVVTVTTKRLGSPPDGGDGSKPDSYRVEIRVADNGNGIPQKVLDKIFQPFFTTKPTGQGTGLGLSLAYDIVKAHGGEIKVQTRENDGTEFIIQLPAN